MLNNSFQLAPGGVDPAQVPFRQTYTGARIPAVGLGTFGSDHVSAETIANGSSYHQEIIPIS